MTKADPVLVTGANGFIGSALMKRLAVDNRFIGRGAIRFQANTPNPPDEYLYTPALGKKGDWSEALQGIRFIVHTAARVQHMPNISTDQLMEYRRINVEGTLHLARQAAYAGVKRFVFLSSIKVNGESTNNRPAFTSKDDPAPQDAYGISKLEAEQALWALATEKRMEVVIIRPPLVYGPGVKGNFSLMMNWVRRGLPLPLGSINNRRSLVALDNLVDLIITCLDHPAAANQVFLAGDNEDLSTAELLCRLGNILERPAKLLSIPPGLLMMTAAILGKQDMAQRLLCSLQVDVSKTRELLDWSPLISVDQGLKKAASPLRGTESHIK